MEQYIPKSALVAEIESLLDKGKYHEEYDCAHRDGNNGALYALKGKVNTLEVKDFWKPADGDDLPEIDREVIALTQPYPNDEHLRVVFAHRPNKYANVWNSDLGEEQVVEIERHGKGGWNQPNVKWWLDCSLPNMEED